MEKLSGIIKKLIDLIKRPRAAASTPKSHITSSSNTSSTSRVSSSTSQGKERMASSFTPPPAYSPPKTALQIFFDDAISKYVLPDIDRLTNEIRPDNKGLKKGLRGCTIPLAMMLFAVIDLFGFVTRDDPKASKTETQENFKYLLSSRYFLPIYKNNWERILKLYRHGVMHQIFPKASAIAKAGPNRPLMYAENGTLVLNVDRLSKDVVKAINQIEKDISQKRDNQLIGRMNSRLEELANDDYQTSIALR